MSNTKIKNPSKRVSDLAGIYVEKLGNIAWNTDHESLAFNGFYDGYRAALKECRGIISRYAPVKPSGQEFKAIIELHGLITDLDQE